jgi:hypothetical protein
MVRASLPPGWHATRRPISGLLEPRPVYAAGSFDLTPGGGPPARGAGCEPAGLLRRMPARGALIEVDRYSRRHLRTGSMHAPPRLRGPLRLDAFRHGRFECGGNYGLTFRTGGRAYVVGVWMSRPTSDVRAGATKVLGSLRFPAAS